LPPPPTRHHFRARYSKGPAGASRHDSSQDRVPRATAEWVARASRAPHTDRGPPNDSHAPPTDLVGQATHSASLAVPVASTPHSHSACAFASVIVTTALMS